MSLRVDMAHQTRDRMRLRIPEKRKDLPFFLDLYEDLRQIPDITDVVINPVTASVLLRFRAESQDSVVRSLQKIGLPVANEEEQGTPGVGRQMNKAIEKDLSRAAQVRTVLMATMIALTIYQIRRGFLIAPTLSVLWFAYDLFVSRKSRFQIADRTPANPPDA